MSLRTPRNRAEMERHVSYVVEHAYGHLRRGTPQALALVVPRLREMSWLPNRRVNLASINESLRLQANMLATFQQDDYSTSPDS